MSTVQFTLNHVTLVDKGQYGPWGYALLTPRGEFNTESADVIELRGVERSTLERIAASLPAIKKDGLALSFQSEIRTEVKDESFVTKAGEPATKRVLRVYMTSTPQWAKVPTAPDMGNLGDILGSGSEDDADGDF